jgi:hypothetical protein
MLPKFPANQKRELAATLVKPEQHQHQDQTIIARFELGHWFLLGQHVVKRRFTEDREYGPRTHGN